MVSTILKCNLFFLASFFCRCHHEIIIAFLTKEKRYALDHGATATAVDVECISPSSSKSRNYERGNVQIKRRSPLQRPMGSWTLKGECKGGDTELSFFEFLTCG